MKRFTLAIVLLFVALTASAQKFGVTGGITMSQFENIKDSGSNGYNVGIAGNFPLALGFSLQPELVYNVKGATLPGASDAKYSTGYCELGLQAQWGLDLIVAKPYVMVEPYIGGAVSNSLKLNGQSVRESMGDIAERLECGFALGAGLEILYNLQLSAKYFWTVGSILDGDRKINTGLGSIASGQINEMLDGAGNFTGTTISLTFFF